jgi:hypothetical protein
MAWKKIFNNPSVFISWKLKMNRQSILQTPSPATLLMSATIKPPSGMPGAVRNDSNLRMQEYINAFKFYLSVDDSLINQIIVVENSDSDLSVFTQVAKELKSKKAIHVINTSSSYPSEKGKGYGEFRMIDEGLDRVFASGAISETTPIWKVTGRLAIKNIGELVRTAPSNYMVYCDLRNAPLIGESLGGNNWMELRVSSFSYQGYMKYFYGKYDAGYTIEKGFFSIMKNALMVEGNGIVPRFVRQPHISGFSGLSNKSYESPAYLTKSVIRQIARSFFPWVWI